VSILLLEDMLIVPLLALVAFWRRPMPRTPLRDRAVAALGMAALALGALVAPGCGC
jgi:hypothetical protein